jgi:endo-1,4-beta-D-glucanase Y
MTRRHFPPPWTYDEANNAYFIVKDANGFAVSYVYLENEPGRRTAANRMTKDEARRIAAGIARLPIARAAARRSGGRKGAYPKAMRRGGLRYRSRAYLPTKRFSNPLGIG